MFFIFIYLIMNYSHHIDPIFFILKSDYIKTLQLRRGKDTAGRQTRPQLCLRKTSSSEAGLIDIKINSVYLYTRSLFSYEKKD